MKIFFLFLLLSGQSFSQSRTSIAQLSWFSGSWRILDGDKTTYENWTPVLNNRLKGNSVTTQNGKVTFKEEMVIESDSTGTLYYRVYQTGQKPVSFKLVTDDGVNIVFENLKHDYPQRISYRRSSGDSLTASIEGVIKKKKQSMQFPFVKVIINAD